MDVKMKIKSKGLSKSGVKEMSCRRVSGDQIGEELSKLSGINLLSQLQFTLAKKIYTCREDHCRPDMVSAFCKIYVLSKIERLHLHKLIIAWIFYEVIVRKFFMDIIVFIQKRFRSKG